MTPEQCRAARAMLNYSQEDLAKSAKVAVSTIIPFELAQRVPRTSTVKKLRAALECAGVEFIEENGGGAGVRLKTIGRGN